MKAHICHISFLLAFFLTIKTAAQPVWTWQKSIGTSFNIEKISKVIVSKDNKVVAVGNVKNKKDGIYFGIFDPNNGSILRETLVKSSGVSVNCIIQAMSDDGYLLFGATQNDKGWLGKTDKNGTLIWEEIYNELTELTEATFSKKEWQQGKEILYAIGLGKKNNNILKLDKIGKRLWQTRFSDNDETKVKAIGTLSDGRLVVCGYEKSGLSSYRSIIKQFDTEGGTLNSQMTNNAVVMHLTVSPDDDVFVAGVDFSAKKGENMLLLHIKKEGNVINRYDFGDTGTDAAFSVTRSTDGAVYLGGYSTKKRSARGGDICIIKSNSTGKNIWQQPLYLNKTNSSVYSIISLPNGKNIVAAGEVNSDAWIGQFTDNSVSPPPILSPPIAKNNTPQPNDRLSVYWIGTPAREPISGKYRVHAFAVSTRPIPKENFKGIINGKNMESGSKFERVMLIDSARKGDEYTYNWRFDVPKNLGVNSVEVEVSNTLGTTKTETAIVTYSSESNMTLHILSIGVPSNLTFTTRDALDFAKIWETQRGITFTDVKTTVLNTAETTRQIPIAKAIEDLKNKYLSGEISKDDWIVVFISSHGFTLSNDSTNFRIAASDYEERYESSTSLNFKDNIWDVLKQIDCKKLVFIDACQSGAIVNRAMATAKREATEQNLLLNDMIDKMMQTEPNLWCVASSSGKQFSWEDPTWQNGAFTEALIEAFLNKNAETVRGALQADADNDQILTFTEMLHFIRLRVPFLVQSVKQQLQTPRLINSEAETDFPIFYIKN